MNDSRYYTLLGMMQLILSNQIAGAFGVILNILAVASFAQATPFLFSKKSKSKVGE